MDQNIVEFGVKNVHVWPIISEDADTGAPTYGEVIAFPSARSISLEAQGDINRYYADNKEWWSSTTGSGTYEGDFNFYHMPPRFEQEVLMMLKNKDGVTAEGTDPKFEPRYYALAFEFEGDANAVRHLFYRVKSTRPQVTGNTTEENKEPEERSISLAASARKDTGLVRVKCSEGDDAYDDWYEAPYEYVETEYEAVQEPTGNPSTSGYYELVNDVYYPSEDTTVDATKTYYTVKTTP